MSHKERRPAGNGPASNTTRQVDKPDHNGPADKPNDIGAYAIPRRATTNSATVYRTSKLNGRKYRRTNAELAAIDNTLMAIADAEKPISVRGLFYRMVSRGLVPKTDHGENNGYGVVQRQVLKLRRAGVMPWSWITDGTRLRLKPTTYTSAEKALDDIARNYRRALWADQGAHVEIWTEKDAIRGVIYPVTAQYDVPLMIARGQSSDTFIYRSAEDINDDGKPTFIYQLGDHDRDGVRAWNAIARKLRGFVDDDIELTFERIAVTPEQITEYDLLTRPDKTDSGFGPCVEVDAIESPELRRLVGDAIERHIDQEALRLTKIAERSERKVFLRMANGWGHR